MISSIMSKLVLYWSLGSQPGRAVKTLLEMGGVAHEARRVNVLKREHKAPEYLRINPMGLLPAITDGHFALAESSAILAYLCEKHPQLTPLHGATLQQRATTNQFLSWYQGHFRPALFKPFRKFLMAAYSAVPLKQQEILQQWRQMWEAIAHFDQILSSSQTDFICGNTLTVADLLYYYELTNLVYFKVGLEKYPKTANWHNRVAAIPEVAAITQEWEGGVARERAEAFERVMAIREWA